ncbi:MAG: putative metal-binding motif-containing protein, partial [Candidatus Aenigmarchaeota archaeon]|nr:putative metal-binding motif-containing protein [Candidatus Aenigmarchaeota archaeon]
MILGKHRVVIFGLFSLGIVVIASLFLAFGGDEYFYAGDTRMMTGQAIVYSPFPFCIRYIPKAVVNPSEQIGIILSIGVPGSDRFYFIDEIVPDGWNVISNGSMDLVYEDPGDGGDGKWHLKTVVLSDAADANYTYAIQAPGYETVSTFYGTYRIENMPESATTTGDTQVTVEQSCVPSTEICNNADDNCNAVIDESCDVDKDSYANQAMACAGSFLDGNGVVRSCITYGGDCNDNDANVHPAAAERCNGVDDDCGGTPLDYGCDDDDDNYCDSSKIIVVGSTIPTCTSTDTSSAATIAATDDCDDALNGVPPLGTDINPGITESCNTYDDDCSGVIDDVGGGHDKETAYCECYGGNPPLANEICDNGIDDDCDMSIDYYDPEGCTYGDSDGDGITDENDNCPYIWNPSQLNTDGQDGGNPCDICPSDSMDDQDGDGICVGNGYCTDSQACGAVKLGDNDNCPSVANMNQNNADGDDFGDACDSCPLDPNNDQDGDGVCGD